MAGERALGLGFEGVVRWRTKMSLDQLINLLAAITLVEMMATSVRNVGVAMVIATGSFGGTAAVTAATAFAVFQTVLMGVIALMWGRIALSSNAVLVEVS